jgi:hypothetical protein
MQNQCRLNPEDISLQLKKTFTYGRNSSLIRTEEYQNRPALREGKKGDLWNSNLNTYFSHKPLIYKSSIQATSKMNAGRLQHCFFTQSPEQGFLPVPNRK